MISNALLWHKGEGAISQLRFGGERRSQCEEVEAKLSWLLPTRENSRGDLQFELSKSPNHRRAGPDSLKNTENISVVFLLLPMDFYL